MNKLLSKLFFPNKIIGFIVFNIAFGMLIFVFSFHLENSSLAYITYLLSTYALIIFCIWFYKIFRLSNNAIKRSILYKNYKKQELLITKICLSFSILLNFIYGLFKLGTGIYYMSWWFITFAIYYLLLCLMRLSIVKEINNKNKINLKKEYKKLKLTGIILLFLNLILLGMILLIIHQNQEIRYAGFIIYIVAIYDFYLIISAFINVFKYRKNNRPVLLASKCINLTVAMISMLSLALSMITQFGKNADNFKVIMISCMGFGIYLINSSMAIYMIIKSNKENKLN